jgi:FkbM family methyltransferase
MLESLIAALRPFQFKGKAWMLLPWTPRSGTQTALVFGYRMELDLIDHIQRMVFPGAYERWETRVVRRLLRPGMCFVDVGANVGYFTLLAARRVGPTGQVFAVEPSTYAADQLSRTILANAIPNIRLERCALGRREGEVILYDAMVGNHSPTMLGEPGCPGRAVPVRTLDGCVLDWAIDRIDLLKIFVEGYEPEVFAGATRTLVEGRLRAILCEFNPHWLSRAGTSSGQVYRDLLACGFVDKSGVAGEPGDSSVENRLLVFGRPGE